MPTFTRSRRRDVTLLWTGQAISGLGSRAMNPALTLLVLAATGSARAAGLVMSMGFLAYLVAQLPAGWLVDRVDLRLTILTCDLTGACAAATVAAAVLAEAVTVPHVVAVVVVLGCTSAIRLTAETVFVPRLTSASTLPRVLAANQARVYGAGLAGPPLGGLLYGFARAAPFLADALSFCVAAACTALLPKATGQPGTSESKQDAEPPWASVRAGLIAFWQARFVRVTALLVAGSDFVINCLPLVVVTLALAQGAGPGTVGLLLAAGSAGGLLGALGASLLRSALSRVGVLLAGAPVLTAAAMLLLTVPGLPVMAVAYALIFVAWPAWNAAVTTRWLTDADEAYRGRVLSAAHLVGAAPTMVAPLAAGIALDSVGAGPLCVALAIVLLIIAVVARMLVGTPPK